MLRLVLYSFLGVLGTGLGGLIAIFMKRDDKMLMTYLLNLAGGMMISISCFKLIPEAMELSNIFLVTVGVLIGVMFIQLFDVFLDIIQKKRGCALPEITVSLSEVECVDTQSIKNCKEKTAKATVYRMGLVMFFAISLHNLPEGLAIGSAGAHEFQIGLILAFTIAFHDVPEGMAIAVPLIMGGMNKGKAVFLTGLSGFTTVIGAILGYLIGGISDTVAAISMALAGGAMIYVTFGEVMPQAILICNNRKTVMFMLIGFLLAMIFMYL